MTSSAVPANRWISFFCLAAGGLAADLATKSWIFGRLGMPLESPPLWLWQGYFGLETSLNEGALFGLGQGMVPVFAVLSLGALAGIVYWLFFAKAALDWLLTISLGMITGGILGNLYDRLGMPGLVWTEHLKPQQAGQKVYAVRDWILVQASDQWRWPNFNIADSLLVCGAGLLICLALKNPAAGTDSDSVSNAAQKRNAA